MQCYTAVPPAVERARNQASHLKAVAKNIGDEVRGEL